MPTLSLCMIVRDEAAMLPQFLEAALGLYDDFCVVDTGSTDATVSLLEGAGARILHRPWDDDFAAARNFGLEHALGDWIICLDADEMCTPELIASARMVLEAEWAGAATVAVRNVLPHGNQVTTYLPRMFRNHPSIRFAHIIHETVIDTLQPYLISNKKAVVQLQGILEHLGYTRERAEARDKQSRDVEMLQALVDANPGDLYGWYKLLEQARFWDDSALLQSAAADAEQALRAATPEALQAHYVGELLTLVAAGLYPEAQTPALQFLYPNAHRPALDFLEPWEERISPSAAYYLRRGELEELEGPGAAGAAEEDFKRCVRLRPQTANTQLAGVRPLLGLARLALARQDLATGLEYLNLALGESPRDPEALLALTSLSRTVGGPERMQAIADAYRATYGDTPELHGALGEAALRAGDTNLAVEELRLAAGDAMAGPYVDLLNEALRAV